MSDESTPKSKSSNDEYELYISSSSTLEYNDILKKSIALLDLPDSKKGNSESYDCNDSYNIQISDNSSPKKKFENINLHNKDTLEKTSSNILQKYKNSGYKSTANRNLTLNSNLVSIHNKKKSLKLTKEYYLSKNQESRKTNKNEEHLADNTVRDKIKDCNELKYTDFYEENELKDSKKRLPEICNNERIKKIELLQSDQESSTAYKSSKPSIKRCQTARSGISTTLNRNRFYSPNKVLLSSRSKNLSIDNTSDSKTCESKEHSDFCQSQKKITDSRDIASFNRTRLNLSSGSRSNNNNKRNRNAFQDSSSSRLSLSYRPLFSRSAILTTVIEQEWIAAKTCSLATPKHNQIKTDLTNTMILEQKYNNMSRSTFNSPTVFSPISPTVKPHRSVIGYDKVRSSTALSLPGANNQVKIKNARVYMEKLSAKTIDSTNPIDLAF